MPGGSGIPQDEAERNAWASVNDETTGSARKSGSGHDAEISKAPAGKGRVGGSVASSSTAAEHRASARKATQTRARTAKNTNASSKRVPYFYPYGVTK